MKQSYDSNATPVIDTVQVRIALLLCGKGFRDLAREWGFGHVTLWRAANNLHTQGPKAQELRRRLATFVEQTLNNTNKEKA